MPLSFEWIVALRFLREGRMQTTLIVAGTTIGVAVIIFITALVNELQASLAKRTLSTQPHITLKPPEDLSRKVMDRSGANVAARIEPRAQRLRSIDQWERIFPQLERLNHVTAVSLAVSGSGFALRGNASKPIVLFGIDPDRYAQIVKVPEKLIAGRYRVAPGEAVIGVELAADLGAGVGDRLRVQTAEGGDDVLRVTGIFDLGVKDINRRWVLVPVKTAQALLSLPGGVTQIDMSVDDIFVAESVARLIGSSTGLLSESWMTVNSQLLSAFESQTMTTRLIRFFLIIIVALGIASVLVVSVVQKQKEIGILRAMGASPGRVMSVFLIQGAIVGVAGAILGSVFATGIIRVAARVLKLDDGSSLISGDIALGVYAGAGLVAVITGVVAAVVPARSAAKLDPVAAIRG